MSKRKMTCAPSKTADQPEHPLSLTSLPYRPQEGFGPKLYIKRPAATLIRLGGCQG